MKKIMFNDKYGLTQAVLEGRKTMTRRICKDQQWSKSDILALNYDKLTLMTPPNYLINEVVAIAQSYKDIGERGFVQEKPTQGDEHIRFGNGGGVEFVWAENHAGYNNKMFVKAELMPHHIKITNIRVKHLQEISNEDCLREGVFECEDGYSRTYGIDHYEEFVHDWLYNTPREAFAALIDKVSGKGTWDSNPMVWVYEFELVD